MSGYRLVAGFGQLSNHDEKDYGQLPSGQTVMGCIQQLTHRFGAGVDLTINRNRNNNYLQDIGLREFTQATSGMYDLDFTINGAFVPEMSSWLKYAVMSDGDIVIKKTSVFKDENGNELGEYSTMPTTGLTEGMLALYIGDTTATYENNRVYQYINTEWVDVGAFNTYQGYVTTGSETYSTKPILYSDFKTYMRKTATQVSQQTVPTASFAHYNSGAVYKYTGSDTEAYKRNHYYKCIRETVGNQVQYNWEDIGIEYRGDEMEFHVFAYINLDGPEYFDIGYAQINENTTNGGLNEYGVLLGCAIESISLNYESGSDMQVKFSINGVAMNEEIFTSSQFFDYNQILDFVPPLAPLVSGCVSVYDTDKSDYEVIAQTDSAGVTLSNNLSKLGNCLKLTYSSVGLGAQNIEMRLSTYSNNPNKVLTYMYGYKEMEDGYTYTIQKQPLNLDRVKIRSNNSSSIMKEGTQMLDINLRNVYVGTANRTYNVDNALMDEPDLRPRRIQIVVGYIPESQ